MNNTLVFVIELVGMEDLAEQIKKGEMNFDVVIASPDAMRVVGQRAADFPFLCACCQGHDGEQQRH